ncbi:hypothetical protein BLOT_001261 [Blomia tropicalis]|nr:hypothetical protein BLOT_001261 [Blomia tropicalis]
MAHKRSQCFASTTFNQFNSNKKQESNSNGYGCPNHAIVNTTSKINVASDHCKFITKQFSKHYNYRYNEGQLNQGNCMRQPFGILIMNASGKVQFPLDGKHVLKVHCGRKDLCSSSSRLCRRLSGEAYRSMRKITNQDKSKTTVTMEKQQFVS